MFKPKTVNQVVIALSGNRKVYDFVQNLVDLERIGKMRIKDGDAYELKTDKVLVTITTTTMVATNVYGTIFEDLTRKDCKLIVNKDNRRKKYDKTTKWY